MKLADGNTRATRLRSVLLATDFSKGAATAARRAARLPLARSAKLTLIHVRDPSERGKPASLEAERSLEREAEHLGTLLTKANAGDGPLVRTKLVFGRAFEEIAREGTKVDLIVLGRHGSGGFAALLLGSTAERVVRSAVAPVLVVGKAPTHGYRHPLAGVDMSAASQRALEFCLRLVPDVGVLEICHAYEPMFERALRRAGYSGGELVKQRREERAQAAKALRAFLEGVAGGVVLRQCRQHVRSGDPRFALLDRAKRRRADLIVVGSQGRSAIARLFLGSVAEAALRNATCDVLVVPRAPTD